MTNDIGELRHALNSTVGWVHVWGWLCYHESLVAVIADESVMMMMYV